MIAISNTITCVQVKKAFCNTGGLCITDFEIVHTTRKPIWCNRQTARTGLIDTLTPEISQYRQEATPSGWQGT